MLSRQLRLPCSRARRSCSCNSSSLSSNLSSGMAAVGKSREAADEPQELDVSTTGAAVAAAEALLARGSPATCLALLVTLPLPQHQQLLVRQLQALCHVQLANSSSVLSPWWKVFGLDPAAASAADVRQQYKRLAALVHPDKCRLAGAADAFPQLQAASQRLLQSLQLADNGEQHLAGGSRCKRARTASYDIADDGGWGDAEDDGWFQDGGGFPWWEEWDRAEAAPAGSGAEEGQPAAPSAATTAAPDPSTARQTGRQSGAQQPQQRQQQNEEADEDQAHLLSMGLDEMRAEVRQRQAGLLEPQLDAAGQQIPLAQLQAALRRARSVLAEAVAAEATERVAATDGGFLH